MGLKFFKEASQRAAQAQALAAQNKKKKEDDERRKRNEQAKKRAEQKKKQQQQKSTLSKPTADTYKFDGNLKKYDGKVNTGNIKLSAPVAKQPVIQNEPVIQQKNSTVKDIASGVGRQLWGGYGKWAEGVNKVAYHGVKYIPGVGSAFKKAIDNQEAYNKANLEKGAEKIQKHLGNGFKSAAVNSLSQSAGQMIPDIVTTFMSAGTNRAASLAKLTADSGVSKWVKALKLPKESTPLFLSNLGNAYDDAIKNGANDGQALTSALINAYPQTVIEHSGGIQDLIKGKSKENVLKSIITSAIDEGKEELLQYPFEELSRLPYAPVTPYSSDPNEQAVINPKAQAQAAAVGALGGLVFGGVNTAFEGAANVAGKTVTGAKLKDFKQDIIDEGLNSPDGTYANDNALKLDNKKHVSLYDIGKQYELNVQQQESYKDGKYHSVPYEQPYKTIVPPSTETEYKTQEKTVKKPVSTEFEGEVKEQQYEKTQQTVNVQAPIPDVRNASAVNGFPNDGVSQNSYDVNRAFTEFEALERAKYNETAKIKAVTPIYMQAKTLNSSQKRLVEDCRTLGIPVTFIEGTRVQTRGSSLNGAYYNGNIFINTSSENPYNVVAAHEVLHRIKDTDPEAYSQLCGIADDALGKDSDFSGLGDYEKEEALADIMGDIIGEPKKYREVFRQKQNLLQRVIGYIRDMIARLTGKISGNFKNVSEFTESLKDAESKLTQIYKESAGKTGSFEGETSKYSILTNSKGKYVKADRQVISGNDPRVWAKQVKDYIDNNIRHGKDVNVLTEDGDILTITKDTSGKARFRNTVQEKDGAKRPMSDSEYAAKLRAETHIDELSEISKNKNTDRPDKKNHGEMAKNGFEYRTVYFEDIDGTFYKLTISVGKGDTINTVYNIGKMDKRNKVSHSLPTQRSHSAKSTLRMTDFDNSISKNSENVNTSSENVTKTQLEDGNPDIRYSKKADAESDTKGETDDYLWHIDSNGKFNFKDGERHIGNYIYPNEAMLTKQDFKLADVLTTYSVPADKFAHLSDTKVVFDENSDSDTGYYDPKTDTIHLAKNDNNFEKNSELILRHVEDIVNGGEKSRVLRGTQGSNGASSTERASYFGNSVSEGGINVNGSGEEVTKKQYNTYSIKELYTVRKHARISEAKAKKGVKFSDSDRAVIKEILKGNIDINSLNPDNINVEGIRRVIKFSQAVHDIEAEISKHKKSIAEERNSAAKKAIEGSDNWRDSKGNFFMSLNTMERNIKNIIPDSESANEVIENYIRPVSKSAADRVRYMDKMREKISNLKLTKDESYAVQFLGERRSELEALQNKKRLSERDTKRIELLTEELADFKKKYSEYDNEKVNGAIKVFRETYNQIFEDMNNALIENGYDPVEYRRFYFPHFTDEGDSVLNKIARLAGLRSTIAEIPGDLTGRTQNFKPGKTFFTNALKRDGDTTSYDALTGFDKYIEGATDVIFQTKNIRNLRALTETLRYKYSKSGVKERINEIKNNDSLPPEEQQSLIDALYSDKNGLSKHNSLINELTEYTNLVANKRSSYDRKWEENWGRTTIYKLMGWAQKNIAGNMIQYNLSSAASNTVALQQASAEINAIDFIHGFFDTVKALAKDDGFNNKSDFLTNRQGSDPVSRSGYEKFTAATDAMQFSDMLVSGIIVRARYYENMRKHGMSETEALSEADNYANTVIAGRAKGEMPTRFAAKNPLTKSYTMFQLEVSNQLHNIFKDAPERILSRDGAWGLAKYITKYLFGAYLYNEIYEKIFGRRMALDPLGMIEESYENFTGYRLPKTIGELNGEKESLYVGKGTTYSALLATSDNLLEQLPFFGSMLGGGRIPYAVAKPEIKNIYDAITGEGDSKKKAGVIISDGVLPLGYALNPFGGLNQLQKTVRGFNAVNNGVVTNTGGNVQYAVGQNPGNYVKGLLLGKSALPEARRYYSGNSKPFSDKDTEEYNKRVANGESNLKVYADINERRKAKDAAEMVNPFIKNSANPSNVGIYKELGRLKQSGKNVEFEAPDTEFEVDGKTVKLDSYKYARYAREAATTAEKETANLFKSKHYAPIDDKEKVLSEVYSYAKALAKTKVSNYTLTPEHQKIKLAAENGISAGEFIAIKQAMGDGPKSVNKVFDFARKNGYGEQESEKLINLMTLTTDEYKRLYQRDGFKSGYRMHLLYYRAKQNGIDAKTCFVPIAKEDFSITDKKAGIKFSTTLSDKEISELQIVYNYYYEGALKSLDKMKFNNVQELYTATQKIRNKMLKSAKRDYYYYLKRTRQG